MIKKISLAVPCLLVSLSSYSLSDNLPKIHHPIRYQENVNHLFASGLSPDQLKNAYNFNSIKAQGEGQVIAIVNAYDHPNIESDLAIFNKEFNLPECTVKNKCFKKVYAKSVKPITNGSWAGEIALGVEWAHAMAPKARIILVEAATSSLDDLYQAVEVAVKQRPNIISMSWGSPEFEEQKKYEHLFANRKITFIAPVGDNGPGTVYPATSPHVLAVGGTTLYVDAYGNYQDELSWSDAGGGLSKFIPWPRYQRIYPIPKSHARRGIPDVAYNANPQTGYSVYNSIPGKSGAGWQVVGGTSAGVPQWAAITAIMNSELDFNIGSRLNVLLYAAANPRTGYYEYLFNSFILGSNGDCGYYCNSRDGYNYVTGLGSLDVGAFIRGMANALE